MQDNFFEGLAEWLRGLATIADSIATVSASSVPPTEPASSPPVVREISIESEDSAN